MFARLGGIGVVAPAQNSDVGYRRDPRYGRARPYRREQRPQHPNLLKSIHLRSPGARAPQRRAQMRTRGLLATIDPPKRRAYHV
jgi:hypothetical protein